MNTICPDIGIYRDVSHDEYLSWAAMSASAIDHWARSTAHGVVYGERKREMAGHVLRMGTALHMRVAEPEEYRRRYRTVRGLRPMAKPETFKIAEVQLRLDQATPNDALPLAEEWAERIEGMATAIKKHPEARWVLGQPDREREVAMVWDDPVLGVRCKLRADWIVRGVGIVDFKTAHTVELGKFARHVVEFGYHRRQAWYQRGVFAVTGAMLPFSMVCVEKEPPYAVEMIELGPDSVQRGWCDCIRAVINYRRWLTTGEVPPYASGIRCIDIPRYAITNGEEPAVALDQLEGTV